MSDKKMAIRDAYGNALAKFGAENDKVMVLEADVGGSTKSAVFGKQFPDRYFNVGIAELNMVSMAAGMAACGMIPFVNTFSVFLATRASDPIQSLAAYDNMNIKLAGTYCGMSDSYDGASHNAITDMAFVRSLPNMTLISVCDPVETEKAVKAAMEWDGPVYLRLSRADSPYIFDDSYDFQIGKGVELKDGKDVTIVATGYMVHKALEAAKILEAKGISAKVVDIHTVQPIDEELITKCAKETGAIVTAEEHSVRGGLGSAVSEVLAKYCPVPMEFAGITEFAESGDYEQLLTKYKLDGAAIAEKAEAVIKKK